MNHIPDLNITLQCSGDRGMGLTFSSNGQAIGDMKLFNNYALAAGIIKHALAYIYEKTGLEFDDLTVAVAHLVTVLEFAEHDASFYRCRYNVMTAVSDTLTDREIASSEAERLIPAVKAGLQDVIDNSPNPEFDEEYDRWLEMVDYDNTLAEMTGRD